MTDDIDIKALSETSAAILALDVRLVDALFAPAVRTEWFDAPLPWAVPGEKYRADKFIEQLLPLSEFYQDINPPLSAAIWGIWNAVSYLRREGSFLSKVFESTENSEKRFVSVRALIATAAIHFSDGKAHTLNVVSVALVDFQNYKKFAEKAISNLTAYMAKEI